MANPIDKFNAVIGRCVNLVNLFTSIEQARTQGSSVPTSYDENCDLVRAAIVLCISGMDAYFTDKFSTMLVPYLKAHGKNKHLVELLSNAGLNTEAALDIIRLERPYRRVRTLVDNYLSRYTTQQMKAVDRLFNAYGIAKFTETAAEKTGRRTILQRIEKLVERRHEIVHDADLNAWGAMQKVDVRKVLNQMKLLAVFVGECDKLADTAL